MDALRSQIAIVSDELATLRAEIAQVKTAHSTMHQGAVETNTQMGQRLMQIEGRMETMATMTTSIVRSFISGLSDQINIQVCLLNWVKLL